MKEKNTNQHYLPVCYLKHFSENGIFINVYSKKYTRARTQQAISKTASKDFFYKIPEQTLSQNSFDDISPNFYEIEYFAKNIEPHYSILLGKINNILVDKNEIYEFLSLEEKKLFARLIAIQYLRLPIVIEKYWDSLEKFGKQSFEIIKSAFSKTYSAEILDSLNLNINHDQRSIHHANLYTDEILITSIQNLILQKEWVFKIDKLNSFVTSDNPIIIEPTMSNQLPFHYGFGMKGANILFPVSSKILLVMLDKNGDSKANEHCSYDFIDQKEKRKYNCYQYIFAREEVYSFNANFDFIRILKEINQGNEIFK